MISDIPAAFANPVILEDIPFFPQDIYQCGPATLATMLTASGISVSPEELMPLVYVPARKGSFQIEMVAVTRSAGRLACQISPSLDTLLLENNAGHPVLVLQNLGMSWYQKWHFAVVGVMTWNGEK